MGCVIDESRGALHLHCMSPHSKARGTVMQNKCKWLSVLAVASPLQQCKVCRERGFGRRLRPPSPPRGKACSFAACMFVGPKPENCVFMVASVCGPSAGEPVVYVRAVEDSNEEVTFMCKHHVILLCGVPMALLLLLNCCCWQLCCSRSGRIKRCCCS